MKKAKKVNVEVSHSDFSIHAIFAHEPYQMTVVASHDYGMENGECWHSITYETAMFNAWGEDITRIAFFNVIDGEEWPAHYIVGYDVMVGYID